MKNTYNKRTAYILWAIAGLTGAHHFYLNHNKRGTVYASLFVAVSTGIILSSLTLILEKIGLINSDSLFSFFLLGLVLCFFWIIDGILLSTTIKRANEKSIPHAKDGFFIKSTL